MTIQEDLGMRGQRIITRALGVIFIAATCLAATPVEAEDDRVLEPAAETTSKVELFQIPKTEWPGFSDMVIDSSGIPWIVTHQPSAMREGWGHRMLR